MTLHPLGHSGCHANQGFDQRLIDIQVAFILSEITLSVRLIEHSPLLAWKVYGVLQALEHKVSAIRAIAMRSQCGKREGMSSIVREVESALATEGCVLRILEPSRPGAVQFGFLSRLPQVPL